MPARTRSPRAPKVPTIQEPIAAHEERVALIREHATASEECKRWAGTAADTAKEVVAIGATSAGASTAFPEASSFLGNEMASALSKVGNLGGYAGYGGGVLSLFNQDWAGALYSSLDNLVYTDVALVGGVSALETAGAAPATAGAFLLTYYNAGGSEGIVQSIVCDTPASPSSLIVLQWK